MGKSVLGAALVATLFACGAGGRAQRCGSDRDCPSPQACSGGFCVNGACGIGSSTCNDDAACGAGLHCNNGCCAPGAADSCASDADCATRPGAHVCDAAHKRCVQCVHAADCGPGRFCVGNVCASQPGCSSSSDCTDAALPVCDTNQHVCVQCLASPDCKDPAAPLCDASHHCVANSSCTKDGDCGKPTPRCQLANGHCVQCLATSDCAAPLVCSGKDTCIQPPSTACASESDCASNPVAPHCKPGAAGAPGTCVACVLDAQCPAGDLCASDNTCQGKQCGSDAQCAAPTPRCDLSPTPHACVACLQDSDCANGALCQPDRTCKAASGCAVDQDCAANISAPHCLASAHTCVACVAPADCGAGKTCTAQDTCVSSVCNVDADCSALAATPHCSGAGGTCVACTSTPQCPAGRKCTAQDACVPVCTAATQATDCAAPSPVCKESPAGNACVQCVRSTDCKGGFVCDSSNTCVAASICVSSADCTNANLAVCDTGATPHACVQCLANADCKNGAGCDAASKTCTQTGAPGEICNADHTCNTGALCIDDTPGGAPHCYSKCNPYTLEVNCPVTTQVCSWLAFDASNTFYGFCTTPNGKGAIGAACNPNLADSCEWNLICAPTSSNAGVCKPVCDPVSGACGGGDVCNPIVGARSGATLLKFGYCGPASKWGQSCSGDTGASGADCGTPPPEPHAYAGASALFCAPSYLPAEVTQTDVLGICAYTPIATTAIGGAADDCSQRGDSDCRTGVCLSDGPVSCFAGCDPSADCARDGAASGTAYCFDFDFATASRTNLLASCAPRCLADTDCPTTGSGFGRTCVPEPVHDGTSWRAVCGSVAGTGKAGAQCTGGSDCASGTCITGATLEALGLGLSVSGFTATDGFCLGTCTPNATTCASAATACSGSVALPLRPENGDQGVMGRPNPAVCWGQTCNRDANCAGLSKDPATPRVCAPYKVVLSNLTTIDTVRSCSVDADCSALAPSICNSSANNPNPGSVYGANAGVFGPNGKCRQLQYQLQCAPSLGASKGGPGATCARNADCATGHCLVAGASSYCFGGCAGDVDCAAGTHCGPGSYLGMSVNFCQP